MPADAEVKGLAVLAAVHLIRQGAAGPAEQRFVKLGEARGDYVRVISGVNAGEEVVTSGVFKLSNGTKLFVDNSLAPKPELAPKPNNS